MANEQLPPLDTIPSVEVRPNMPLADKDALLQRTQAEAELQTELDAEQASGQVDIDPTEALVVDALAEGMDRPTAKRFIQGTAGVDEDTADSMLVDTLSKQIQQAREAGGSDEEIKQFLQSNNYDYDIVNSALDYSKAPKKYKNLDFNPNDSLQERVQDMSDLYNNLYSKYSTTAKAIGGIVDTETGVTARQEVNELNKTIAIKMQEQGFDTSVNPETGELMYRDPDSGEMFEADSSFLNSLFNSKAETGGAVAGAVAGAQAGAAIGTMAAPGVGTAIGGAIGAIGGSAVGAMGGRGLDILLNSKRLGEDIEGDLYKQQIIEAGIADAVMGAVGAGVFKAGKAAFKTTGKVVMKAYDLAIKGNIDGATRALKAIGNFTEEQIDQIVSDFKNTLDTPLQVRKNALMARLGIDASTRNATEAETRIAAVANTQKGLDSVVSKAVSNDPALANTVVRNVDRRAKELNALIDKSTSEEVGSLVRKDLQAYKKDVKDFYGLVKDTAAEAIDGTDFKFDYEKLAIKPVLDQLQKTISNPDMLNRFLNYSARIEAASQDRSFSGLVNLRQAVNDFKYSKVLGKKEYDALNMSINKIDAEIAKAAKKYMPNAKQWIEDFSKAKLEYAKMMKLEENVLVKALNKEGKSEAGLAKDLLKYVNAADNTFNAVLERVTPDVRAKVESAIIKVLTSKHTIGKETGFQAIDLPQLADELTKLNIKTPQARRLLSVVNEMAKVFKNDPALGYASGSISSPKYASSLSTDIVAKTHFALVGKVFETMMSLVPGKSGDQLALVKVVSKVLDNPLNAKAVDELVSKVPPASKEAVSTLVKDMQAATAQQAYKTGTKPGSDFVKMYKKSTNGKLIKSKGSLGEGVYLSKKVTNPGGASNVISQDVNMSRMATLDNISSIYGQQLAESDIRNTKGLQEELVSRGYQGIQVGDKVMLFPDNIVGHSFKKTINNTPIEKVTNE